MFNTETESRRYEDRRKKLLKYRRFIMDIFQYSGEEMREVKKSQQSESTRKERAFFLTEVKGKNAIQNGQDPKQFVALLNKIEDDNLMLIRTLQNQKHEIQSLEARIAQ